MQVIKKVGKGSSGYVYKAEDKITKEIFALKESSSKENDELIKREITIYEKFNNESPYIIKYYDFFKSKNGHNKMCLYLQLEYCHFGSIREIIKHGRKNNISITENEISSIIYMVVHGIKFIHSKNLIDRDIKGRNILINNEGEVKLCDFGICCPYIENKMKKLRGGSPYWMAPEILKKEEYNQNIDIWALGITCIELAEYEPPYSKLNPNEVIKEIIKSPPQGLKNPEKWSKEFNDFIRRCLEIDKKKRPLSDELLKHDFITMIDKKNLNRKLVILQFLSRCGYKIIYNRKTKFILPANNHIIKTNRTIYTRKNETICNFLFKSLNHKSSLENINNNKNNINNISNTGSSLNINTNNTSSYNLNNLGNNEQKDSRHLITLKCSKIFNKKHFFRTRSVERDSINNKKYNFTHSNYIPCLTSNDRKINYTPGLRNIYSKRNISIKNSDLNEKNDNTINEEDELFDKEKIYEDEIKSLMKERNEKINNIIIKYEDKISKMKMGNKVYLKKNIQSDNNGIKKNLENRVYSSRWKLRNTNSGILNEKVFDEKYYNNKS